MTLISSRSNSKIKQVRALRQRKTRQESALFLVEGIRHVGEAVEAGASLESIVVAPQLLKAEYAQQLIHAQAQRGVPVFEVTPDVFESVSDKDNPQGILAVVHMQPRQLDELHPQNFDWGVALVSPQDPGNVGTILRTLDAVGASGLILLESSVDLYHPGAVRASMGAMFWLPVVHAGFAEFTAWAGRHGYHILGTSAHGTIDYCEIRSYPRPRILLMGSERQGLDPEQIAVCEQLVRLPMRGRSTSLNLAVAAGVMLYQMMGE